MLMVCLKVVQKLYDQLFIIYGAKNTNNTTLLNFINKQNYNNLYKLIF